MHAKQIRKTDSPSPPARGWQRGYFRVELIKLKTTTNNWIVRRTERLRSIGSKHLFEIQVSNRVNPSISKSRRDERGVPKRWNFHRDSEKSGK